MNYIDEVAFAVKHAVPPDRLPDEPGVDDLCRIYALLVLAKGTSLTARDVHDAWSTWMTMRDPNHASLRPFDELDAETRSEDIPFLSALLDVASARR